MKLLPTLVAVCAIGFSQASAEDQAGPQRDPNEPIGVNWTFSQIPGTNLETDNFFSLQKKSGWTQHRCTIGYRQTAASGSFRIVPVVCLPDLENDRYLVEFEAGILRVLKKKSRSLVMELHLDAIAPSLVTSGREGAEKTDPDDDSAPDDVSEPEPDVEKDSR